MARRFTPEAFFRAVKPGVAGAKTTKQFPKPPHRFRFDQAEVLVVIEADRRQAALRPHRAGRWPY